MDLRRVVEISQTYEYLHDRAETLTLIAANDIFRLLLVTQYIASLATKP